jgi:hypothetical protein
MKSLPVEVLLSIFTIGCDSEDGDCGFSSKITWTQPCHLKPFMRSVSQVCSTWRQVAISGSTFWITIIALSASRTEGFNIQQAELYLQDSAGSDLDFDLLEPFFGWPPHPTKLEFIKWLEKTLLPLKHRIRRLSISVYSQENVLLSSLTSQSRASDWPRLRNLALHSSTGRITEGPGSTCNFTSMIAPGLRSLTLNISGRDVEPPGFGGRVPLFELHLPHLEALKLPAVIWS